MTVVVLLLVMPAKVRAETCNRLHGSQSLSWSISTGRDDWSWCLISVMGDSRPMRLKMHK